MGRLVINIATTVNAAFEAPAPEPDGWLVLDDDSNQVSLDQLVVAAAMVVECAGSPAALGLSAAEARRRLEALK